MKPECPLCKQKFRNIIHNIRSDNDFDEYEVKPPPQPAEFGFDRYNSSMTFERMELMRHIQQMQSQLQVRNLA